MRYLKLALIILVSACSTIAGMGIQLTRLSPTPLPPRPANYVVRIYREQRPRCAFDEIAILSAKRTMATLTMDALIEVMRAKAREVGGDAIIGLASETRTTGASQSADGSVDFAHSQVWTGTIIRFKSPECAE